MKPQAFINTVVELVKPVVAEIEAQPAITQNRYDRYMVAITTLQAAPWLAKFNDRQALLFAGVVLTQAGGNRAGIQAALRALGAM